MAAQSELQKRIAQAPAVAGIAIDPARLLRFYETTGFAPAWTQAGGALTPAGAAALTQIETADADGLDPARYRTAELRRRVTAANLAEADRIDAELLLTQSLLQYLSDLHGGQIVPGMLDERGETSNPDAPQFDPVEIAARARVAMPDQVPVVLASATPPTAEYRALKRALGIYRQIAATVTWPTVPAIAGTSSLKPGMSDGEAVPALRARIVAGGWLPDGRSADPALYDEALADGVMDFQRKHGIDPDGAIGKNTRTALNTSPAERVRQLVVNLERSRWTDDTVSGRYVLVNIAAFWLTAIENGVSVLEMPVVVGQAYRQTPTFSSRITATVVNPRWTVPRTIATKDILPAMQKDPGYMQARGLVLLDGQDPQGPALDPYSVDWKRASILRYRLVHPPGPKNPLGRFKFVIPNTDDIYLHDSPETAKFQRDLRFFSSGCVRVGDARALAGFVLRGIAPEKIDAALETGDTSTITAPRSIPVHLVYRTAWLDPTGNLVLGGDFYGRDSKLMTAIEQVRRGKAPALKASAPKTVPAAPQPVQRTAARDSA